MLYKISLKSDIEQNIHSFNEYKNHRCDHKIHNSICCVTESSLFDSFIMTVIILNAIVMGLETIYKEEEFSLLFYTFDQIFLFIFTFEFLLKVYAKPFGYFKNLWNLFDLINLIFGYFDWIINLLEIEDKKASIAVFKAMRSFKALRTLRAVSFVQGLQVIVNALISTLSNSVINVTIVILLFMFIFSIIEIHFFNPNRTGLVYQAPCGHCSGLFAQMNGQRSKQILKAILVLDYSLHSLFLSVILCLQIFSLV